MALCVNLQTGEQINLLVQHIFGRHPDSVNTVLTNLDASRMHATILWDGEFWVLQDSSSNGTFVNGVRISRGSKQKLALNDTINFGSLNAPGWQLPDIESPQSMLVPETPGLATIMLEKMAVLPNEASPEITLYLNSAGQWQCESQAGSSTLKNGDRVGTSESIWRFTEAKVCAETRLVAEPKIDYTAETAVFFDVSQNEEHVALRLKLGLQDIDLKQRNHHYLLLLLARQRLADKQKGVTAREQGWLDKSVLCKMLKQGENHINIQIYRFRKQLLGALPDSQSSPQIIERRSGEIRFACDAIQIQGGGQAL